MYNVQASALRFRGTIEVTVTGLLADSCVKADINDFYPGGNIVYVRDPGYAQVFIKEWREENSTYCTFGLVPWVDHVRIPDTEHDTLHVYVNGNLQLEAPIIDLPEPKTSETVERTGLTGERSILPGGLYIVIALIDANDDKHFGCQIIPANSIYPQIYKQVFGPAEYAQCEAYLAKYCDDPIHHPPRPGDAGAKSASPASRTQRLAGVDGSQVTPGGPGVSPWPGGPTPWPGPAPWPGPWPNPPFPYPPIPSPPWPYPWPNPPFPPIPPIPWPGPDPAPEIERLREIAAKRKKMAARGLASAKSASPKFVRDDEDIERDCMDALERAAEALLTGYDGDTPPFSATHSPSKKASSKDQWGSCLARAARHLRNDGYANLSVTEDDVDETFKKKFYEIAEYLRKKIKGDV